MGVKMQKRILLAYDDKNFNGVVESILNSAGHRVKTVETAGSAFRELRKHQYDLLVLDIGLPGGMAPKLCQALKNNIQYLKLPILIMLESNTFEQIDEEQEIAKSGDVCIQKPIEPSEFLASVQGLLERMAG